MEKEIQSKLRQQARELLSENKIDWLAGFAGGSLKFTATPLITRNADDAETLVVNPFTTSNLANFILGLEGKVGIVAKGCDGRSIVSLIQDNKIKRDELFIIGIPCEGLIDLTKVEQATGLERDEIDEISRDGSIVYVNKKEFDQADLLYDSCLACELPTPREYDAMLGEPSQPIGKAAKAKEKLERLQEMPPEERWSFWQKEFERCTRCYACRNVCPACYCKRCFVEETEPQWLAPIPRWQENLMFQVVRNLHLAGRCTDCGECQRACPVGIPLRGLTRDMYDRVDELFGFKSGMDIDQQPLLTAYEVSEAEGLMG